jgi:hypothetical protein
MSSSWRRWKSARDTDWTVPTPNAADNPELSESNGRKIIGRANECPNGSVSVVTKVRAKPRLRTRRKGDEPVRGLEKAMEQQFRAIKR